MGVYRALGALGLLYSLISGSMASDATSSQEGTEVARVFEQFAAELLCRDLDTEGAHRMVGPALQMLRKKDSALRGEAPDPNRFGSAIPIDGSGGEMMNTGEPGPDPGPPPILDPNSIPRLIVFEPREPRAKPGSAPEPRASLGPEASASPQLKPEPKL